MKQKNPHSKIHDTFDFESLIASISEVKPSELSETDLTADFSTDTQDKEKQDLSNAEMEERVHGLTQDREERKTYASRFFWLVAAWVLVLTALLFLEQYCGRPGEACLANSVLITALATTTATIVSVIVLVGRYLFKQ